MRHLPALRQKQTALLFVVVPGIPVLAVDIELIAAHGEPCRRSNLIRNHHAAIIDAAVAPAGNPVVHLEFEILGSAAAPDDERVAFDDGLGSDLPGHHSVRSAPVFRIALPPVESLAVENALKAVFIALDWLRPVALFGYKRRGRLLLGYRPTRRARGQRCEKQPAPKTPVNRLVISIHSCVHYERFQEASRGNKRSAS